MPSAGQINAEKKPNHYQSLLLVCFSTSYFPIWYENSRYRGFKDRVHSENNYTGFVETKSGAAVKLQHWTYLKTAWPITFHDGPCSIFGWKVSNFQTTLVWESEGDLVDDLSKIQEPSRLQSDFYPINWKSFNSGCLLVCSEQILSQF